MAFGGQNKECERLVSQLCPALPPSPTPTPISLWIKSLRQGGSYSWGSFRGHKDSGGIWWTEQRTSYSPGSLRGHKDSSGIWWTEQRMWKVSVSAVPRPTPPTPPPACSISISLWSKSLRQGGSYSWGSVRGHKNSSGIWRTEQRMWKVSVSAVPRPTPPSPLQLVALASASELKAYARAGAIAQEV